MANSASISASIAGRYAQALFDIVKESGGIDQLATQINDLKAALQGSDALRDMITNHALQLLALIAMEPPARYDKDAIRDEKAKVFRCLRMMTPEEVPNIATRSGSIAKRSAFARRKRIAALVSCR